MNNMLLIDICPLFKGHTNCEIEKILSSIDYRISSYSKGEVIASEGEKCTSLGIVLKGNAEVQKIFASGKAITVSHLSMGETFGEVIIFSKMTSYPSTIMSSNSSQIMFISKDYILKLCSSNETILKNFMEILSSKILTLNNKLRSTSYQTLKQKIGNMILEEYKKQKTLQVKMPYSRKEMAEYLGIPRPSLSRELINMKKERLIELDKNNITIISIENLESIFFE